MIERQPAAGRLRSFFSMSLVFLISVYIRFTVATAFSWYSLQTIISLHESRTTSMNASIFSASSPFPTLFPRFSHYSAMAFPARYTSILPYLPLILVFLLLVFPLLHRSALRKFPGPLAAKYTDLWRCYNVRRGKANLTALKLHRKHGTAVRVGPNVISLSDPAVVKTVFTTKGVWRKVRLPPRP